MLLPSLTPVSAVDPPANEILHAVIFFNAALIIHNPPLAFLCEFLTLRGIQGVSRRTLKP